MTDTPTDTWPNPNAPGVPANPERDGWHWLRRRISGQWFSVVLHWQGGWIVAGGAGFIYPEALAAQGAEYLGPCFTPAEVAAREAAAWCAGRDAAAADADCGCDEREAVLAAKTKVERIFACSREPCCAMEAQSIRELEPPADLSAALAAREAAAKADGMREAAGIAVTVRQRANECAREPGLIDNIRREYLAQARGAEDVQEAILARVAEIKP